MRLIYIYRKLNTLFWTNNPASRSLLRTIDVSRVTKLFDHERSALTASKFNWKSFFSWLNIYISELQIKSLLISLFVEAAEKLIFNQVALLILCCMRIIQFIRYSLKS